MKKLAINSTLTIILSLAFYFSYTCYTKNSIIIPNELKETYNYFKKIEKKSSYRLIENISLYDQYGKQQSIDNIITNDNTLVFFYNESLHCKMCVDETINIIDDKLSLDLFENNFVIFVKLGSLQGLNLFRRLNKLEGIRVYLLNNIELDIPLEELDVPFFFVINKNRQVTECKAVIKDIPVLTASYLNKINLKFK